MTKLDSKHYEELKNEAANIIEDFCIDKYPFDILTFLKKIGIRSIPYSFLDPALSKWLRNVFPDAFTIVCTNNISRATIFYNDIDQSRERIRFTLAHEFAHLWLGHPSTKEENDEAAADFLAGYFMVPVPLAWKYSQPTEPTLMRNFDVSLSCARAALKRMESRIKFGPKKLTDYEERILNTVRVIEERESD